MSIKHKILYIEDEKPIRKLLHFILESAGHQPIEACSGSEGLMLAASHQPDVILLDLGLADISGTDLLAKLREWSKTPVIILTANKADDEKVTLLDMGADDYLVKPFHAPELLARIRVAIRHAEKSIPDPVISLGKLNIDCAGHLVKVGLEQIKLTSTEFDLLKVLAQNAGKVVTQRQLLQDVWGPNNSHNSHYLRVYIAQLRKKIEGPLGKRIIYTESGVGYRLTQDD
ncbi:MAG: hypothetical protein A2X86_01880 [Bdellovibrionales bacterium GWA2_49_15]|nr:MAG: hypothetical protein A2X86_01880 [Bdellovibrionales bacterium GWA2_49_15]